jgi:hypothetical protein
MFQVEGKSTHNDTTDESAENEKMARDGMVICVGHPQSRVQVDFLGLACCLTLY